MSEVWLPIKNFPDYEVSNFGRVRSFKQKKPCFKHATANEYGYMVVLLFDGRGRYYNRKVHRLVAEAFIPNPDGKPQVNHINGVKSDNRVANLEWVTASQNIRHGYRTGLIGNKPRHRFKIDELRDIVENPDGLSQSRLAKKYGTRATTISNIQSRYRKPSSFRPRPLRPNCRGNLFLPLGLEVS